MEKKRALIIIDVQQGLFEKKTEVYNSDQLIANINTIIDIFRRTENKIVFIQYTNKSSLIKGSMDWEIHPEIKVLEQDIRIIKNKSDVFKEKTLINYLKKEGITNLVIAGLVTHGCVQAACLSGKELGFNITLINDAQSNFNKNAKELIDHWNKNLENQGISIFSTNEFTKII